MIRVSSLQCFQKRKTLSVNHETWKEKGKGRRKNNEESEKAGKSDNETHLHHFPDKRQ